MDELPCDVERPLSRRVEFLEHVEDVPRLLAVAERGLRRVLRADAAGDRGRERDRPPLRIEGGDPHRGGIPRHPPVALDPDALGDRPAARSPDARSIDGGDERAAAPGRHRARPDAAVEHPLHPRVGVVGPPGQRQGLVVDGEFGQPAAVGVERGRFAERGAGHARGGEVDGHDVAAGRGGEPLAGGAVGHGVDRGGGQGDAGVEPGRAVERAADLQAGIAFVEVERLRPAVEPRGDHDHPGLGRRGLPAAGLAGRIAGPFERGERLLRRAGSGVVAGRRDMPLGGGRGPDRKARKPRGRRRAARAGQPDDHRGDRRAAALLTGCGVHEGRCPEAGGGRQDSPTQGVRAVDAIRPAAAVGTGDQRPTVGGFSAASRHSPHQSRSSVCGQIPTWRSRSSSTGGGTGGIRRHCPQPPPCCSCGSTRQNQQEPQTCGEAVEATFGPMPEV